MREVLIDCDQVIADFLGGMRDALGLPHWVPAAQWDFLSNLSPADKERALRVWARPGFIRGLPLIPGAQRGIAEVMGEAPVRIVTAMEDAGRDERLEWLWEHFRIDEDQVSFELDKSVVPGKVLMDDRLHHVQVWSRARKRRAYLFGAPHNAGDPWPHRVDSWEDAPKLLIAAAREGD